jgi:hypothetical protein
MNKNKTNNYITEKISHKYDPKNDQKLEFQTTEFMHDDKNESRTYDRKYYSEPSDLQKAFMKRSLNITE